MPGAPDEKEGVEASADLKDGCGPAGGGGRGGRDECSCGVVVADGGMCGALRPGGGGYDMMNGCTVHP